MLLWVYWSGIHTEAATHHLLFGGVSGGAVALGALTGVGLSPIGVIASANASWASFGERAMRGLVTARLPTERNRLTYRKSLYAKNGSFGLNHREKTCRREAERCR